MGTLINFCVHSNQPLERSRKSKEPRMRRGLMHLTITIKRIAHETASWKEESFEQNTIERPRIKKKILVEKA